MSTTRTHIVVNPASSGGKTRGRQERILEALRGRLTGEVTLFVTTKPHEATDSTRAAVRQGANLVVVIGGDGTLHETLNGFAIDGQLINPSCQLGVICSGTGEDAARSFQLPKSTREQIETVCGDRSRPIDIGRVAYTPDSGPATRQFFFNECQQGISAVVVQRFQAHHKWMGGFLGFGLAAVVTAARYREQVISLEIDGKHILTDYLLGVVVANGGFAGGGMNFAPYAKVDDGLFDIILIHKQNVPSRLLNFPKIYSGSHINLSWVSSYQGRVIRITSSERVPMESDGELLGHLPCTIDVLPRALQLKA